jgi:hypothetical protein
MKLLTRSCVAPEGAQSQNTAYPALKRWAMLFRPAARDLIVAAPNLLANSASTTSVRLILVAAFLARRNHSLDAIGQQSQLDCPRIVSGHDFQSCRNRCNKVRALALQKMVSQGLKPKSLLIECGTPEGVP